MLSITNKRLSFIMLVDNISKSALHESNFLQRVRLTRKYLRCKKLADSLTTAHYFQCSLESDRKNSRKLSFQKYPLLFPFLSFYQGKNSEHLKFFQGARKTL